MTLAEQWGFVFLWLKITYRQAPVISNLRSESRGSHQLPEATCGRVTAGR